MKLQATLALLVAVSIAPALVDGYSFVPSRWGSSVPLKAPPVAFKHTSLVMKDGAKESFTLASMFGSKNKSPSDSNPIKKLRGEPHPSVRPHISPLNRLAKDMTTLSPASTNEPLPVHPLVRSGILDNGMPYIILPNKSPPGRFEVHLQVFSGSGKFTNSNSMCYSSVLRFRFYSCALKLVPSWN